MSDNSGILGEILEQGVSTVKQAGQQIKQIPVGVAKGVAGQVKGTDQTKLPDQPSADLPAGRQDEKTKTEEFVKDLYGVNKEPAAVPTQTSSQNTKSGEKLQETEEQKIAKLRQELHANYYRQLVNPSKPPEEKKADELERKKQEEMVDLNQKEKKKPPPLAVQRAAQKTEKFPGASG